jgi:hypothetical protein
VSCGLADELDIHGTWRKQEIKSDFDSETSLVEITW